MIELNIRNKWITLGGSSYVTDKDENKVFNVKGRIFSFTRKKFINDLEGNTLYIVRNKFWHLFVKRAFVLDKEGNKVCTVRKKFWSLRSKFFIDDYKDELIIDGNILTYNFDIRKNGVSIGHVARKISLRDSFVLTCYTKEDEAFLVALVIAIDNIIDRQRNEADSVSFNSGD